MPEFHTRIPATEGHTSTGHKPCRQLRVRHRPDRHEYSDAWHRGEPSAKSSSSTSRSTPDEHQTLASGVAERQANGLFDARALRRALLIDFNFDWEWPCRRRPVGATLLHRPVLPSERTDGGGGVRPHFGSSISRQDFRQHQPIAIMTQSADRNKSNVHRH